MQQYENPMHKTLAHDALSYRLNIATSCLMVMQNSDMKMTLSDNS